MITPNETQGPDQFNKEAFITYINDNVFEGEGKINIIKIEFYIVNYFEKSVFKDGVLVFVPEYAKTINELILEHKSRLLIHDRTREVGKNELNTIAQKKKFLTLTFPNYDKDDNLTTNWVNYLNFLGI